jgi:hypothetical protein
MDRKRQEKKNAKLQGNINTINCHSTKMIKGKYSSTLLKYLFKKSYINVKMNTVYIEIIFRGAKWNTK